MGTWGFGVFDDDTALDIRDAYRSLLAEGKSGPAAAKSVLSQMAEDFDDEDDGPVAWLALAATQWSVGRLDERTKKKAFKIIASPDILRRWEGAPKLLARRQQSLQKLRQQLASPQPAEKKFTPRKQASRSWKNWALGEYFGFLLRKGTFVLLRVQSTSDWGISFAVVEWVGKELPSIQEIPKLPVPDEGSFTASTRSEKDLPHERLVRLHVSKKFKVTHFSGGGVVRRWSQVPNYIKRILKIR